MKTTNERIDRVGKCFEDSEGLRALLTRLHHAGHGAWQNDPEAAALMEHAAAKYAALARKHGLDPWEAAAAAFDAMRAPSVRHAVDPWAVITHAVRITCIAEERANGLLCSVHQARRPKYSEFHDPERFGDRENPLTDYDPALRTDPFAQEDVGDVESEAATGVRMAIGDAITLLRLLGWADGTARAGVEYVTVRLASASSRGSAFESLRRDRHAQAFLDLSSASWLALLRVLLGNPDPALASTNVGRGVLLRLLIGEPLHSLLRDVDVVLTVGLAAPRHLDDGGEPA